MLDHLQQMKFDVKTLPEQIYTIKPNGGLTRSLTSRLVLMELHGSSFTPPPPSGIFADLPAGSSDMAWVEEAFHEGLMEACSSSMNFCPDEGVTRAEAARIILLAKYGQDYTPPAATGLFSDVPVSSPFSPWVEQLYREGITSGCVASPLSFCQDDPISVKELSTLLERAFNTP